MIDHWRLGETLPFPFTAGAIDAAAATRLELHP
jgi:hypothetical protein